MRCCQRFLTVALLALLFFGLTTVQLAALPAGFTDVLVAGGIPLPTAFVFTPDGRILVTEKEGRVRVIQNGSLIATPALTLPVNVVSERGLLGIALDPAFASNGFVYLYYTTSNLSFQPPGHPFASPKNRIARFTISGNVISAGSQTIILDDIFSDAGNHNGGWIQFGPDGKLYASTGDGGANSMNAQTLANLSGKILRINADGTIPSSNPFFNTAGARREIFCWGLRNPWRFTWDGSGRLFIGDVGSNKFEEINVGGPGLNYGWPIVEGLANRPGFVDPIYNYPHGNGAAITLGVFSDGTVYPSQYAGLLFFGDSSQGFVRTLKFNPGNGTATVQAFATDIPGPVHFQSGPDGLIYYAAIGSNEIRRFNFPSQLQAVPVPADYTGDFHADAGIFRAPGDWIIRSSSSGLSTTTPFGTPALGDIPAPGDYDDDGLADLAVYRPSLARFSINGSTDGMSTLILGTPALKEKPVVADYDGDHIADPAVFSTTTAGWIIRRSTNGSTFSQQWGAIHLGDQPVPVDYDGDGSADIAVFRTSTAQWFVRRSSNGSLLQQTFGMANDVPVPGDYDGDGIADFAIFRKGTALWSIRRSTNLTTFNLQWGNTSIGDVPVPADYDGDTVIDIAVYRKSSNQWFIRRSTDGGVTIFP